MQHQPVRRLLLDRHRAVTLLFAVAACGDNLCPGPSTEATCRTSRIAGSVANGELGFRFGEPIDLDGDGEVEIAGGARYANGPGEASVWTRDGRLLAHWNGDIEGALFGHDVLGVPDLDGDGRGDVIVSAPNAMIDGGSRGFVDAYALDGHRIWRAEGALNDGFGWHVARAGDHDGDHVEDLWVTAPSNPERGHVYLVSGRDGHVLVTITGTRAAEQFGWYAVPTDDLDGDGEPDVAIGAIAANIGGAERGAVTLASARDGHVIRELAGELPDHFFGQMLAPLPDLDGDHAGDLAIAAPGGKIMSAPGSSEVYIISGATGERLHILTGREDGELYGRMIAPIDDLDGDGLRDLAIAAPLSDGANGRIELRSSRSLAIIDELRGTDTGWLGWHIAALPGGFVASQLKANSAAGELDVIELR